jgi:hypothetical protein
LLGTRQKLQDEREIERERENKERENKEREKKENGRETTGAGEVSLQIFIVR